MESGLVVVEKVGGRSTLTRYFAKYPLKLVSPTKVGSCKSDVVWVYTVSFGGGMISGDHVSCAMSEGDDCTAVLTTQASTKVYRAVGSKSSDQYLQVRIGCNALVTVLPHPVTCFASAKYKQKQVFSVSRSSSRVVVDWAFNSYNTTNHIISNEDQQPLLLDSLLMEQGSSMKGTCGMQDYQVIAMIILLRHKLEHVQNEIQEKVKKKMSEVFGMRLTSKRQHDRDMKPDLTYGRSKPELIASCSMFSLKDAGLVIRVAATTTGLVYKFLQEHLASLEPLLGASPYY
ncbi:hypothetical protein AMTRI_Chr05g61970 [Amborella trichopoda]